MIVVTGAAGLVGNILVKELVDNNQHVKAIVTPTDDLRVFDGVDADILFGDVRDQAFLKKEFKGADVVYHLAGIVSITPGQRDLMEEVNLGGTQNIINACLHAGVRRLVYMSSVHALTELPHGKLIDETTPIAPEKVIGDYAKSKARATLAVLDSVKKGLDAVVVYPSGIIGPYSYNVSNMAQLLIDYAKGKIPVRIEGTYDFVDVRDVVSGTIAACEKGEAGDNFILSGYQVTLKQLFAILSHITGQKRPRLYLPNWLLRGFIPLANFLAKRSQRMPTLTSYALYSLSSNSLFSHEKATEKLDYYPRHIANTIEDTIHWYEKIGKV